MRISQRSIETIRETSNIVEVASEFTALRRQGARFSGLCPYPDHQEKTPSFSVTPEQGFYYCFGCQRGGDAIKLVTDLKSLSFAEAVSYLAERSGTELEFEGGSEADSKAARDRTLRRRKIHKALAAAAIYYHKYLLKSQTPQAEESREYLKQRGLVLSTIEEFRLGYAPPRGSSGFSGVAGRFELDRRILDAAGILSSRGGERFAGRITFPISDRRGRMVGFGARALGDDHPKYLNSPETDVFNKRELLYGFPQVAEAIRRERAALVVEGYTDVLMLYQSGIKNAVATLGTATTPAHLKTLSGYADTIYLLFDPDTAGEKAIERAAVTASELKLDLRVVRLSEDPADWLLKHQPEEFTDLLTAATSVLEYIFRRKADQARGSDAAERARTVSEIRDLLRDIDDPVFYRDAIRVATEALGVSPEALQGSNGPDGRRDARTRPSTVQSAAQSPILRAGREVLALILTRPDLTSRPLREGVSAAEIPEPVMLGAPDFADEAQARLFTLLSEHAGDDLDAVLADDRARDLMEQIAALYAEGEKLYPSEAVVRESWLRLAILSRQRAKQDAPDLDAKERLHSEIQRLKEALRAVSSEP
ncbi:MAG TPA: DNA primase [Rubrobacteraceae bacterium]|nr:DNA primase [Rubrobacteraceae bacterium]